MGNGKNGSAICVLDNDPSVLRALSRVLSAADWEVQAFADVEPCLDHVYVHQSKVIVLDLVMPEMHGLHVQTAIRALSPETAVIVLTSNDDANLRAQALSRGAAAFFVKPAKAGEFLAAIKSAHDNHGAR